MHNGIVSVQDEYKGDANAYVSFGEDRNKELYIVNMANGSIYRIAAATQTVTTAPQSAVSLQVYPNPAKSYCTASYTTAKAETCTIVLYNAVGVQVFTANKMSIAGKNNWQIIVPANVRGNCYITVTSASGTRIRQGILIE
ncbi:hypothetical protein FC093_08090 [Ilyomonas limi]|uniref:T9SS type A sorting domain-containing protein n=1 Tax=Ilyomonas limi TaxID=2575867 RepID=A0A4U3L4K9_9BACT|nr:hypothetical protein [Ilyomonas limi]TKK69269.1 hypothetical protein FC093_08090 [Ilyomonas limi]